LHIAEELPPAEAYNFIDELTGTIYHRTRSSLCDEGLYVRLDPAMAHIFRVEPAS
jgi:hypothetical protein